MNPKFKVLIVDDDTDVINVMKTILEHEGYSVYVAYNKAEALEIASLMKPDLAILDVMMTTHYEGFELAKAISRDPVLKEMPVVIQTSLEVLTTSNFSVEQMAREFRKDRRYKELQILLIRDIISGEACIDYLDEEGMSVIVPVNGFVSKPVDSNNLLPVISKLLKTVSAK
jgi:twitching motility two-component system response regulator PilH